MVRAKPTTVARSCCLPLLVSLASCGAKLGTSASETACEPDATVVSDADASDAGAGPDTTVSNIDSASPSVDSAADTRASWDGGEAGLSPPADCIAAVKLPEQGSCTDVCILVMRLDYESKRLLGYRMFCDPPPPYGFPDVRLDDARLIAQGGLRLDAPPEGTMSGFDFALWHRPTGALASGDGGVGANAGSFAIVEKTIGRLVVGGTMDLTSTGGEIVYPALSSWLPPPSPALRCAAKFSGDAIPIYPPEGPAFGAFQAQEVVDAAWSSAIGQAYEARSYIGPSKAAVFRYSPTYGGSFRDWIVVVHPGYPCCSGEC